MDWKFSPSDVTSFNPYIYINVKAQAEPRNWKKWDRMVEPIGQLYILFYSRRIYGSMDIV
jgi:hypothetical protein